MKKVLITLALLISILFSFGQTTKTFAFKIEGMSCQSCVNTVTKVLQQIKGVDSVSVDLVTKKAFVISNNKITINILKKAIKTKTNFEPLFAGKTLTKPLTKKEKKGLDIKTILGGSKIKFKNHLVKGKITIFDFYADWCSPCKVFSPKVERIILENKNIALRKVDVVSWKSKLAKQLTKKYRLPALPFTLIFDDKGKLLGKVEGNNIEKIIEIIATK